MDVTPKASLLGDTSGRHFGPAFATVAVALSAPADLVEVSTTGRASCGRKRTRLWPTLARVDTPIVEIKCDRCRRPVVFVQCWVDDEGYDRMLFHRDRFGREPLSINPDFLRHRYAKNTGTRVGSEMLDADQHAEMNRYRLACKGRKHPAYEQIVTRQNLHRAHAAAVAAGKSSVGMVEV